MLRASLEKSSSHVQSQHHDLTVNNIYFSVFGTLIIITHSTQLVEPRVLQLANHLLVVHEGVVVRDVLSDVLSAEAGVETGGAPSSGREGSREGGSLHISRGVDRQ